MTRNQTELAAALAVAVLGTLLHAEKPAPPKQAEPQAEAKLLPWLPSLADGIARAQQRQQPIFVRVGSESCGWCRKLEAEVAKPEVQQELARWTLVSLDAEKAGRQAKSLAVGAVPALRLLTPAGRVMATRDGYLPADQLVAWLKAHHAKTIVLPPDELTAAGAPTPAAVARLVSELKNRDPALREAAVRRLLPYPVLAAPAVAEAFARGNLQERLAALELLNEWKAPVGELDPWKPETLTANRLQALARWAADPKHPAAPGGELPREQLAAARRDLARLVQAPDTEAAAIRERLARHGAALLPEVYVRLKDAATDQEKERLTTLRYRLAASNALALGWPGGLEQLASTVAARRHQAVQELVGRVGAADEALLLELFSSPDPLVRELSLRGLHKIAGREATNALTRLLADPEPNVRAAVLKQLAEKPTVALVPQIRGYLAKEKDTDLVVHAVRVLRGIKGQAAVTSLNELLKHESWRVRAEAAEGIGQYLKAHQYQLAEPVKEDIHAALIAALEDPDGFVVGRAVKGLKEANTPAMIEPLVGAARKHPDLAADVIKALGNSSSTQSASVPHFRAFCKHQAADVRAAAILQLCQATSDPEAELRAALADKSGTVRTAAASALFGLLESRREAAQNPRAGGPVMAAPPPAGGFLDGLRRLFGGKPAKEMPKPKKGEKKDDPSAALDAALEKLRAGEGRPQWMTGLAELLLPMLDSADPEERLAAARPLVAYGKEDRALPVLLAVARQRPDLQGIGAEALIWLPWAKRHAFFQQLLALKPPPDVLSQIIHQLGRSRDERALPVFLALARRPDLEPGQAATLVEALRYVFFGRHYFYNLSHEPIPVADRQKAAAAIRPLTGDGSELQRLIALAVLRIAAPDEAIALAEKLFADAKAPAALRDDAFRLILLLKPKADARRLAQENLSHPLPAVRRSALTIVAGDASYYFSHVREHQIDLVAGDSLFSRDSVGPGQPWKPNLPKGLKPEMVRPLLEDTDPAIVAGAGYLLALLGDPAGLPTVVRYWREQAHDDETWARRVYRAIATLGDDDQLPVLEEIYRGFEAGHYYDVKEFYWTIRVIDGPNLLKLRKRIRNEVGMEQLN